VQQREFHLVHSPDAPASARRVLEEQVDWLPGEERLDDLVLLTSELVANALRHSDPLPDGTIGLLLDISDEVVRVAVTDGGNHLAPDELAFESRSDGHFGMFLLDQRSNGWGFSLDGLKGVWFEIWRHDG
jgi:anti-sigma regulatory factor (Ser/Thr protein kinase)